MFDPQSRSDDAPGATNGASPADPAGRPGVSDYLLAMNHELRTPLNAVIGMSALLLDSPLEDGPRQYVRKINTAGESLGMILNDLLDLARVSVGRLPIEPMAFDLRSMVEETVKALSQRSSERGLALRVDWRPDLPRYVTGDPGRIRQVLGNLVGRALVATSRGEVVVRVAAEGETPAGRLVNFSVEDTGIGLPEDRIERVFDDYVPVDVAAYRSFGVTGLGLRISAELVRLMGGEIGAESDLGAGSRFWFRLPLAAAEPRTGLVLDPGTGGGGRLLVVEADPASRARIAAEAEMVGWRVEEADDVAGVEAVLRAAASAGDPFQACVLSAYAVRPAHAALAMHLKADRVLAPVALVMLTAVGSAGEGKRLWHAGFSGYLRRPVPTEEFQDLLQVLAQVGPDGRGPALITRHALAEARHASAKLDGIDEVLDGLTTAAVPTALVIGAKGLDQVEVTDALAHSGMGIECAATLAEAVERMQAGDYRLILFDADRSDLRSTDALSRIARHRGDALVAGLTADPALRESLVQAGADDVLFKPVRPTDIDRLAPPEAGAEDQVADSDETPTAEAAASAAEEATSPTDEAATATDDAAIAAAEPAAPAEEDAQAPAAAAEALEPVPDLDAPDLAAGTEPPPEADVETPDERRAAATNVVEDADPARGETRAEPDVAGAGEPVGEALPRANAEVENASAESPEVEPMGPELDASADAEPPLAIELTAELEVPPEPGLAARPEAPIGQTAAEQTTEPPAATMPPTAKLVLEQTPEIDLAELDVDVPEDIIRGDLRSGAEAEPVEGFVANDLAALTDVTFTAEPADFDTGLGIESASEPVGPEGTPLEPDLELSEDMLEPPPAPQPDPAPTGAEASADPPPPELPIVGDTVVEQLRTGGAGAFTHHLVATFLREAPEHIAAIVRSSTSGDPAGLAEGVRSIRAMGRLLGAERLGSVGEQIEADLDQGAVAAATGRVGALEVAFLEVRKALEDAAPAVDAAASERPAINQTFLDQLSPERDGAARALALRLVESFREETPARLDELVDAIEREDTEEVLRLAPTLKGVCGLIGADPMAKLCALVEADARLRRVGGARRHVEGLRFEFDRVLRAFPQPSEA